MMTRVERFASYQQRLTPEVESRLRRIAGVRRVDIGYRYVEGEEKDSLAVRLFVSGRKPRRKLPKTKEEERNFAPRTIAGLPIDVISLAPAATLSTVPPAAAPIAAPTGRPLVGGMAIGQPGSSFVTLGAVMRSAAFPDAQIVTSHESGYVGTPTLQYGPDGSAKRIGQVVNCRPDLLCALVQVDQGVDVAPYTVYQSPPMVGIAGPADVQRLVVARAPLQKYGAGTHRTSGRLNGGEASDGTLAIVGAQALAGDHDCGAIWMTADGIAVALQFAIENGGKLALAQAMHNISVGLALIVP